MIIVPKEHFNIIKEKIKEAPTFVFSVLDYIIKGTVLADSTNYESLLIKTDSGLYYVTGQSSDELFLKNIVRINEESVNQGKRFTLFSTNTTWNQAIEKCLDNKVRKIQRYGFSYDLVAYKNRKRSVNSEYDVTKINQYLIEHCLEFDKKYYEEYWDSTENFLQNGIGFCVKDGERIIGEVVSIFKSSNYAEVDIITDSNYRGKGLASIVAEQFIDYCLSHNIQPRWDCDVDNVASINLGSKLGFNNPKEYTVYIKI
ncbi:GNAT family N-acetyltransferase [Psychrobacillus sp. FJAT-21963]|uniref:GNAT family N-acetyltransferase n=1 Tax=Psychrobacillus sp. FJAT-21963 TaxID=1712028 RepID=UPI0007003166|nr:GNAT family N-acetyltransferase [Psychrobacillus sp. FJAT-21963]KQL37197.1 acetyltransferase [Psychrobacillus sp. FJAT-21963]